ncbi:MAG TPA: hypothetical protein VKU41_23235, partial [Polyangiaceae bacterium]|nr:hypothetical protein [Polyangiaceae bacterium]
MKRYIVAPLMFGAACARAPHADLAASGAPPTATAVFPAPPASSPPPPAASESAAAASSAAASVTPEAPEPLEGADFIAQARVLFRVGVCGPAGDVPAAFDPAVIARNCDDLGKAYDEYRKDWVDVARPVLGALQPKDLPRAVVYPFGGGDLSSALTTFPDAAEITTISLEPAGDVRPIEKLAPERLGRELAVHRAHLERLFEKAHSRTENLEKESKTELPGEILFALGALVVHGDEPVSLRYFRLRPDGTVSYVTTEDIDALAHKPREQRALFDDVELRFRASGDAGAPVQVLRHIGFNLDDAHLKADPSLLAYLSAKGKVAAMTKAASHLLWSDQFTMIRGWLLEHTDWMVSDSTGVPPRFAQPAGFLQETYGKFTGPAPFGLLDGRDADDF